MALSGDEAKYLSDRPRNSWTIYILHKVSGTFKPTVQEMWWETIVSTNLFWKFLNHCFCSFISTFICLDSFLNKRRTFCINSNVLGCLVNIISVRRRNMFLNQILSSTTKNIHFLDPGEKLINLTTHWLFNSLPVYYDCEIMVFYGLNCNKGSGHVR